MGERLARRVALIGWDAADWRIIHPLLDAGLMPNLQRLVERGSMGNIATLEPCVSPMLWTSIATGKTADRHGITGFIEPDPATGGVRPIFSSSRKVKALWNILHQSGLRSLVVNWFASHPAEPIRGAYVADSYRTATAPYGAGWELTPDSVHPAGLAGTLADLRVHPGDLTGDDLLPFIPELARIDQKRDRRLLTLARILSENITAHAAATWLMENQEWDLLAVCYDTLDHTGHVFMPYHPPRMDNVTEEDFEIYQHVMQGVYCFHDLMLGRLVELAGPEAAIIVVSDHGFHSGSRRPTARAALACETPLDWHRKHGVLCMAGPGIRQDELMYGATLLDVAPTVLAMFGLAIGEDMQGRVLSEAFDRRAVWDRIPSWEDVPGECGMHPQESRPADLDSAIVLQQLAALGYIDAPAQFARETLRVAKMHQAFNLARVYLSQGNPAEALPLMEEVTLAAPDDVTFQLYLAQCYFETGRLEDCRRVAGAVLAREKDRPAAQLIEANLCLAEGRTGEALSRLLAAEESGRPAEGIRYLIGQVYLNLGRWEEAERAFRRLLEIDPEHAPGLAGLAQALVGRGAMEQAAEAAADSLALRFDLPEGHFTLGVALARLGRWDRAMQAFETCLKLRPQMGAAREWLARLQEAHIASRPQTGDPRVYASAGD
jgi:tetratricopeptide (TPR) repeat protein